MGPGQATPNRATLDQQGLQDFLEISRSQLRRLINSGDAPPFFYLGQRRRWLVASVVRWMESRERDAASKRRQVSR